MMPSNFNRWVASFFICIAVSSANADQTLQAISQQVNMDAPIAGQFEQQKYLQILPHPLLSKGIYQLNQEGYLLWQVTSPIASELRFDDTGIQQFIDGKQAWAVASDKPGVATIGEVLRAVLSSNWDSLKQYFSVDSQLSDTYWEINLVPTSPGLATAIKRIHLQGEHQLQQMTLFEANGDRTELLFSSNEPIKGSE